MKKTLAPGILMSLAVVALVVLAVPVLRAGEYHVGITLKCQECHVMHYSQAHAYDGGTTVGPPDHASMDSGPHEKLLRQAANALCLSCHDSKPTVPDVLTGNTGSTIRQGGALNDTTTTNPYEDWKGHTLGSTDAPPRTAGSGGTWMPDDPEGLLCVDCHLPHGSATQYRNVDPDTGDGSGLTVTYQVGGTFDNVEDVFLDAWTLGNMSNYAVANVHFSEPTGTASAMGAWCAGCHGEFHGQAGDGHMGGTGGTGWLRHPTADADIGDVGDSTHSSLTRYSGMTNKVKVMDPDDADEATVDDDETPTCVSCHKVHGNQRPFGLIYMSGTGTVSEEGDSNGTQLRDLCKQCHVQ